jgi:hypothetical protein
VSLVEKLLGIPLLTALPERKEGMVLVSRSVISMKTENKATMKTKM